MVDAHEARGRPLTAATVVGPGIGVLYTGMSEGCGIILWKFDGVESGGFDRAHRNPYAVVCRGQKKMEKRRKVTVDCFDRDGM